MRSSEQQIRFCTSSDGVSLAYATVGKGPPLVKAANWLNHLEYDWNSPVWRHWISELSRDHTLIRYDERACGLSDWNVNDFSLEAWVSDLEAVVEAAKLERFPLLGISQGGPIAITYAVRHPEKVSQLILYGSYATGLYHRNLSKEALEEADVFLQLIRVGWGKDHAAFRQVFTSLFMPDATPEEANWFNELQRVSCSPENAARMLEGFFNLDVRDIAGQVKVPTLVLHAQGDLRIPFTEGRRLAALIQGSRFVPLDSKNHILLRTEPAWQRFLKEVRSFLGVNQDENATLLKVRATNTEPSRPITASRWKEISALFQQAAGLGTTERSQFLGQVDDLDLRRQVEALLEREAATGVATEFDDVIKGSILSFQHNADSLEGITISHYRVLEKLGEGGMGTVYKARDERLDRFVALKFLPPYLSARQDIKTRFIQEAKAAAALEHPNICTIYDIGDAPDGQLFISMACYEGETLREKLQRGPLPVDVALSYAIQAAHGLAQAHAADIVHRDIKPANLFVTTRDQVKILDFGVAKVADVHLTSAGVLVGTVAYMSPEQGDGRTTDYRTDMWSLGVVLYEMLAGKHPFAGELGDVSLYAIQHQKPRSLITVRPEIPPSLDAIVNRLLAKRPEQRYDRLDELIAELQSLQGQRTTDQARKSVSRSQILTESRGLGVAAVSQIVSGAEARLFVGREHEMERLELLLDSTTAGDGRIVFITGEAGLGKTSLASQFVEKTIRHGNGIMCLSGHCVEQYGASEAYLPFLNAFGRLLNGPAKSSVMPLLLNYAPTWSLQFTSAFTSTDVRDQLRRETMGATQERMLREMGDCLGAMAERLTLVMLLEDLHWADPPSINLIRYLSKVIGGMRLLLIGTFRPDDLEVVNAPLRDCRRELQGTDQFEEMMLGVLDREAIARYLDARFPLNDFSHELAQLILQKTGGHPLFVTRLAKDLGERGDIIRQNSHWSLARNVSEVSLEMPESVRGMIRRRVAMLVEKDAQLLRYASVQGEEFLSRVTAELLSVDLPEIEERLERLATSSHLVRNCGEEELPDGSMSTRYRFVHALYRNALYDDLVAARRRQLHLQTADLLEKHYDEKASLIAAQLAMHFELARDFNRAIHYLIEVGNNAAKVHAILEAIGHFTTAINLVDKLPRSEHGSSLMPLFVKRGRASLACGRFDPAIADFERAIDLARANGDVETEHGAINGLMITLLVSHRMDEMAVYAQAGLKLSSRSANKGLRLETLNYVAQQRTCDGELAEAIKITEQIISEADPVEHQAALAMALLQRGQLHLHQTEYAKAITSLKKGLELTLAMGDGFKHLYGTFILGMAEGNAGKIADALATFDELKTLSERNCDRFWLVRYPNCVGWIYRELQDFDRAVSYDQQGAEVTQSTPLQEVLAHSLINLAQDHVERGAPEVSHSALSQAEVARDRDPWMKWRHGMRLQAAQAEYWLAQKDAVRCEEYARELLRVARLYDDRKYEAVAHKLLGEIAIMRDQPEEAESEFNAAIAVLENYPAVLVGWKIHAALGRLRRERGEVELARQGFAAAAGIINQIAVNVTDEELRKTFLTSPAVTEVLAAC
ncbi:MAG TPA: alpha/beta fold hydrolase [Pyrinomonadaceae bacterium]|nr:alpha/beta fold hydrolase [Pyrinomonadaceae bacterium]